MVSTRARKVAVVSTSPHIAVVPGHKQISKQVSFISYEDLLCVKAERWLVVK